MIAKRKWIVQYREQMRREMEAHALRDYQRARREHAFLLRCEGLKLREIGERLGITGQTVRMHLAKEARRLAWAMRKSTIEIMEEADGHQSDEH